MTSPHPSTSVTALRPSWSAYRIWVNRALRFVIAVPIGVGIALAWPGSADEVVIVLALTAIMIAVTSGVNALMISRSSVTLGDDAIVFRGVWGRTELKRSDDLIGLLGGQAYWIRSHARNTDILVIRRRPGVHDKQGSGPRIRLNSGMFTRDQLEQVAAFAGPGVEVHDETYTLLELDRIIPGTSTWYERHAIATGVALGLGMVVLVAVGVVAYFAIKDLPPFDGTPPREVATVTVERQDAVVADLTAALGGEWDVIKPSLLGCKDENGRSGWQRIADAQPVESASMPEPSREMLDSLGDLIEASGYGHLQGSSDSDDVRLTGRIESSPEGRSEVIVDFDQDFPGINTTSACERP